MEQLMENLLVVKRRPTRRRKQAVLDESQNLELFMQLAPESFVD